MPGPWEKYAPTTQATPVEDGPWTKYAGPTVEAKPGADATPKSAPKDMPKLQQEPQKGFLGSFADSSGLSMLGNAILHPRDTVRNVVGALNPNNIGNDDVHNPILDSVAGQVNSTIGHLKQGYHDARGGNDAGPQLQHPGSTPNRYSAVSHLISAIPVLGPMLDEATDQNADKNYGGEAGTLAGFATSVAAPEAFRGAPGGLKRLVAGDVTEPIANEGISPLQRYNAAKSIGVNLNAADATNSPLLNSVRKLNEHSLVGSPTYEAAKAKNIGALNTAANTTLDAMSPLSREEGGRLMQNNLEGDRIRLEGGATSRYQDLSAAMGDRPMDGSEVLGRVAQNILDEETPFNEKYPHLVPKQAMGIINDIANRFKPGEPVKSSLVDEFGKPLYSEPSQPLGLTYPEAQNIRSRTMDVTRRTNDLTADRGIGMLKQIVAAADDAITNSAGGLNPEQLEIYRDANERYAEMKDKYDNPSSPLASAIRTDNPSSLTEGIGQKTPEQVRDLIPRLGPEGTGAMQRGVAEHAMGTDQNGNRNLSGFGKRFYALPEDYRQELFQPNPLFAGENPPMSDDFHQPLKDIATTSNALKKDLNSSGSAKQAQVLTEAGLLIPTGGVPLLQYPIAKLMHSPRFIESLMKPIEGPGPRSVIGRSAAVAAGEPKKKGLYGTH